MKRMKMRSIRISLKKMMEKKGIVIVVLKFLISLLFGSTNEINQWL